MGGGTEHNLRLRQAFFLLQAHDELETIHVGQQDIGEQQVGLLGPDDFQRFLGARGHEHAVTVVPEHIGQGSVMTALAFDDQNGGRGLLPDFRLDLQHFPRSLAD
jgi:hypothetical protein